MRNNKLSPILKKKKKKKRICICTYYFECLADIEGRWYTLG